MSDTTCWVLINANGTEATNGEYAPHYPDEKAANEARDGIEEYGEVISPLTVRQRAKACVIVACLCCGYVYDKDGTHTVHWDDLAEAANALPGLEGGVFAPEGWRCQPCNEGECDHG